MEHKIITTTASGINLEHVVITYDDGSFKTFPADESNPEYIAFLAQLEAEETE